MAKLKHYDVLAVSLLFAGLFFLYLLQFSGPSGVNGYFYLKQIKFFFETNTLYFQDKSIAFALPFLLRPLLGADLLTFQVSFAVALAGFIMSQGLIFKKLSASSNNKAAWLFVLPFLYLMTNPHFLFFAMNFYKNIAALMFVSFGVYFYLCFSEATQKRYLILSFLFFITSIFCHKSSIFYFALFLVSVVLTSRYKKQWLVSTIVVGSLGGLAFYFYFPRAGAYVQYLSESFHFSLGYVQWLSNQARIGNLIFCNYIVLLAILGHAIYGFILQRNTKKTKLQCEVYWLFISLVTVVAVLPFYKNGNNEIGYRLLLANIALSGPAIAFLLSEFKRLGGVLLGLLICQFVFATPASSYFLNFKDRKSVV